MKHVATGQPEVEQRVSVMKKALAALFMLLAYEASQFITLWVRPLTFIVPRKFVQEHAWVGYYDHHLVQLLLALACIALLSRGKFSQYGLNFNNAKSSWRILGVFCLVCSVLVFIFNVAPPLFTHTRPTFDYAITSTNMIGWLSFEWVFVGISEEIVFRGLIQTYLSRTWRGVVTIGRLSIPTAGIVTTIIFCLAHIGIFHWHFDWSQQVLAFGLGIYYSTVYYRTKSLLNPILAHNFSDGIIYTSLYLLYWGLR